MPEKNKICKLSLTWEKKFMRESQLNNRNFILKCMEKYAQRKILFQAA